MSNEEVDDTEFFQQDFTTASEWEIYNARLEELFHEWKLPYAAIGKKLSKNELSLCEWSVISETISFADVELNVMLYKASTGEENTDDGDTSRSEHECQTFIDLMSADNEYCIVDEKTTTPLVHPLAQWYGLREFVIVVPAKTDISNESKIRILMSSIHIAVSDSNCEIPVFVQVLDKSQNMFLGVCESGSVRLSFDIIHLQTTPPTCKYLSGLLDMFKGKIGMQYVDPVAVTVRLTYGLHKFFNASYITERAVPFSGNDSDATLDPNSVIPFGVAVDPVSEIVLYCTWQEVAENVVIDSQNYSDFDPLTAPLWSIRARFEDSPVCYMSESILEYLQISESRRALTEFFSELAYGATQSIEGSNPFDLLTESKIPSLSSVLPTMSKKDKHDLKLEGPLNDDQLKQLLYFLFPDAQPESTCEYDLSETQAFDPMKIKSAQLDSLVHRLSTLLAICNSSFGGQRAVAQLWAEFAQEMRYRVERCIQIPGITYGFPDSRTCLLHQKLQMLNICMERRKIREGGLPFAMTSPSSTKAKKAELGEGNSNDSDDEFFDCSDDDEETKKSRHALWNQPAGRLSRLGKMLLVDSDEPLYIPITQEPVPKTEDQLEDDAEVMLKLGPGSELCAQMMSASLLSDMESFKAANPAGKLADFIRWYSPRDWIEDESDERDPFGRKGVLSPRMLIPGNTWQNVWETARPVAARRQKRLFDDTKEAEKVLHYFESRTIGQISQLTVATLFHTAIMKIQAEASDDSEIIPNFEESIEKIIALCCKLSRENWVQNAATNRGNSQKKYEHLLIEITQLENAIIQVRSLKKKLFPEKETLDDNEKLILKSLLQGFETELCDGARSDVSIRVLNIFTEAKKAHNEQFIEGEQNVTLSLPNPIEKQFTLRLSGKTTSKGMGSPQFMRAILGQNEFRLCGAFSENTTFY